MQAIMHITAQYPTVFSGVNGFFSQWPWLSISLGGLSAFAIFGILFWFFDKFIWKLKWIHEIAGIPDFSGTWEGVLKSSFNDALEIPVTMVIKQNWSKLSVVSTFPESQSGSDSAHIEVSQSEGPLLKFTYVNRATNISWDEKAHQGTNELFFQDIDKKTKRYNLIRAYYYNNREKHGNTGIITLKRKVSAGANP
jgi:hypothetical protein